jgi:hypothetical protein
MKTHLPILTAAIFTLVACDGEKVQEAKKETVEAAKAAGEASKEVGGKILDKTKEGLKAAGEKLKEAKEVISEKGGPALESFKAKMGGFSEMIKGMEGQAGDDPAKAKQMMDTVMTKLKSISAEGVPPDLHTAFKNYQASMGRVFEYAKKIPSDPAAARQWEIDHADEGLKLEKESTAALKALKEAAARHGLTGLDLGE